MSGLIKYQGGKLTNHQGVPVVEILEVSDKPEAVIDMQLVRAIETTLARLHPASPVFQEAIADLEKSLSQKYDVIGLAQTAIAAIASNSQTVLSYQQETNTQLIQLQRDLEVKRLDVERARVEAERAKAEAEKAKAEASVSACNAQPSQQVVILQSLFTPEGAFVSMGILFVSLIALLATYSLLENKHVQPMRSALPMEVRHVG